MKVKRPRPIHVLLGELRKDFHTYFESGLCRLIRRMYLMDFFTMHEKMTLDNYLFVRRPHACEMTGFWWPIGHKESRIEWLEEQIEKTKQESDDS